MRILLLTETLTAGGAEKFVVRLANALAADHQVTVAVMHGERVQAAVAADLDNRVRLDRLLLPAKRLLFKADSALRLAGIDLPILHHVQKRWLRRIIERDRPEILHSHLLKADRLASELRGDGHERRHVITLHGDYAPFLHGQADAQMLGVGSRVASIIARADAIVGVATAQLDYFAARYSAAVGKLHLIYNGYAPRPVDPARTARAALGLPDDAFLFGMVARGIVAKGWDKAIAAFNALERDNAALVLVGEGPYLDIVRAQPLPDNILLSGFSANPVEYVRHFDVGLLPSRYPAESLPTVVMEYLCEGKPVIATDIGEIGNMLRAPNGELAGILLGLDNDELSVAELTDAMRLMIDDPDLRRRQSVLARGAFGKFDMDECARCYVELYGEVAAGSARSSSISDSH